MSAANVRTSITAIHNDLTFSKRDVYLWVKVHPQHYEFQTATARESLMEGVSLALANILNSDEKELECHLIVTSSIFDTKKWRDGYLESAKYNSPPEYFEEYTLDMARHIWGYEFREKGVYIGVNLGYRSDFSPKKSAAFRFGIIENLMNRVAGEVDEYLSEKELAFWEDKARLVRYSLIESEIKASEVSASEIVYIIRKNMFPGMLAPNINDLSITNSQHWGAGELETLFDGDVENKSKWLEITQIVNHEPVTGYRATLCFAKFPDVMVYPNKEPWIHSASRLGFPVDIHSRFNVVPSTKVKKQVGNKIKAFEDQMNNMTSAGGQVSLEVSEKMKLGQYLEYALSNDDTPWLYGRHRIVIEASSEQELKERCQSVIDHYKALGIFVIWSSGDQLDLLLETTPNDRVRLSSYHQRHELNIIGAGVPAGSGGAGDLPKRGPSGDIKGWVGPFLGFTNSRIVEPVFLSIQSAIAAGSPPAMVITGAPGTGKSFTAFTLTYNMVLSGVKTIYIDPKMDALPLATLRGCNGPGETTVVDLRTGHDGLLDPFRIGDTEGEKIDLVLDTVIMFLGGSKNVSPEGSAQLSRSIKSTLKERHPSLNKLTEILKASKQPDAASIGEKLSIIRKLPFARLCFSEEGKAEVTHLNLDSKLTLITLLGLEMPNSATPREDYSTRNQLAVAILFLLTSFTRKLMISTDEEEQLLPKAIVIDEAWAITSTAQGLKMVLEVARMGRSLNTALLLVSQNAKDFSGEGVTNSVSTKLAFGTKDENEVDNVLNFFSLPTDKANRDVVMNLEIGQCLLKDASGRIARVQVDGWNKEMSRAFETNPIAKRRNAEEDALQS
jgi:hypothetical protein